MTTTEHPCRRRGHQARPARPSGPGSASAHLRPAGERPASTARGLHHTALISSDVETTVRFYQDVLGLPAHRADREPRLPRAPRTSSSTSATATCWPSSTSPASTSARTPRCSAGCTTWRSASSPSAGTSSSAGSTEAGVEHEVHSGVSVYFRDPDGARIELIADPLGEMYGQHVL